MAQIGGTPNGNVLPVNITQVGNTQINNMLPMNIAQIAARPVVSSINGVLNVHTV